MGNRLERFHGSSVVTLSDPPTQILLADSLNVVDLLKADLVLIEQPALARMEEVYA